MSRGFGPSPEGTRALAADLRELVALSSVSSPAPDRAGLAAAAAWVAGCLRRHGARRVRVRSGGSGPVVLAERRGAPGAPVVLCYAHLDVVGPGSGTWASPPFRPVCRAGVLYGRGTSDDKGPLLAQVHAMGRHRGPVGWKFVVDGAEEVGSPDLAGLLRREAGWLGDVGAVLVCDTEATSDGRPTLTRSLRGQLTVRITVRGSGRELHAGRYGGAVPNPAQAVTEVLAALHRTDGSTALPTLRRGDLPSGGTDDLDRRLAPVAAPGWGERAPTPGAGVANRPATIVTALCAGTCAPGPWHVIPATAAATVNVRLVPGQAPAGVLADLRRHVRAHLRPGVRATVRPLVAVPAWSAGTLPGPVTRSARRAVREVWGTGAVDVRSGGTVPAVALLARALPRAEIVALGVTRPGDGAHGPDEHVDPRRLDATAATLCRIADLLGGPS